MIHKGFTLVETLVAITILLLVVIGPMTVAQKGIQNAYHASEQATAVFLAQEAIEAVREIRDNEALRIFAGGSGQTAGWVSDLDNACENGCEYGGTAGQEQFISCGTRTNCGDMYLNSEGRYVLGSQSGTVEAFNREVFVSQSNPAGTAEVSVVVTWDSPVFANPGSVTLQTWIYDQYQRYEPN